MSSRIIAPERGEEKMEIPKIDLLMLTGASVFPKILEASIKKAPRTFPTAGGQRTHLPGTTGAAGGMFARFLIIFAKIFFTFFGAERSGGSGVSRPLYTYPIRVRIFTYLLYSY